MIPFRPVALAAASVVVIAGGCSSDSAKTPVALKLTEYAITVDAPAVRTGKVKISAANIGGGKHEVVVLATGDVGGLPTRDDGSLDEDKIDAALKMGEVGEIEIGKSGSKSFDLKPGTYTVMCNLVDKNADGTVVSHYAKGMTATFLVA